MKYLVVFIVVAIAISVWRHRNTPAGRTMSIRAPTKMVECAYCHVHLPHGEALLHSDAAYCSAEHRRLGSAP